MRLRPNEFDIYLDNQKYWDNDTVVEISIAGVYDNPEDILEYYMLQNKEFTGAMIFMKHLNIFVIVKKGGTIFHKSCKATP